MGDGSGMLIGMWGLGFEVWDIRFCFGIVFWVIFGVWEKWLLSGV